MRCFSLATLITSALLGWSASAQEVPQAVVAECQQLVTAAKLPECLGEGAVGFILMERSGTQEYFGPEAKPVVETCREQNDSYASTWTCVIEAAASAVETARLIGREAIIDPCVRAVADESILDRLRSEQRDLRARFRPSATLFGGTIYRQFLGCPNLLEDTRSIGERDPLAAAIGDAVDAASASEDTRLYDIAECEAIATVDRFLADRSADELRAIFPALETLEEENRLAALSEYGLPDEVLKTIMQRAEQSESAAMGITFLAFGLLGRHHPELVLDVLAMTPNQDSMAIGLLPMLTEGVLAAYEEACF